MKKSLILVAALLLPFTAFADENGNENGNGCRNRCGDTTNTTNNKGGKGGDGGTGIGIGIGIGKGGSAYSKAYGGNAKAYGGSAYQGQNQSQGQVGILKNVGPQVVITDESVTTFEEKYQAPSMGAPGIDTSQVSVECPLYVQDGWSGSLSGPGAGASLGATDAQQIDVCFAWLAAQNAPTGSPAKAVASLVAYCLSFDTIGVENKACEDWRSSVAGRDVTKDDERKIRIGAPDDTDGRS